VLNVGGRNTTHGDTSHVVDHCQRSAVIVRPNHHTSGMGHTGGMAIFSSNYVTPASADAVSLSGCGPAHYEHVRSLCRLRALAHNPSFLFAGRIS